MRAALRIFNKEIMDKITQINFNLEEAVKDYFEGLWPGMETPEQCNTEMHFTPPAIMRLVTHFYELRKQAKQEPEGLDEAAKRNAGLNFDREMECDSFWHDVETFKAGVEWTFGQFDKEAVEGVAEELYRDDVIHCTIGVRACFKPGEEVYVIRKK